MSTTGSLQRSVPWSRRRPPTLRRPTILAKAVAEALTAKKPKSRYLAGHGAKAAVALARTASDGIKDRAVVREAHLPPPRVIEPCGAQASRAQRKPTLPAELSGELPCRAATRYRRQ